MGLPIGARILEEKGRGLFIAAGTSMGFGCGSWTAGDGADTSVWYSQRERRYQKAFQEMQKETILKSLINR